jgi:hypothetical protein
MAPAESNLSTIMHAGPHTHVHRRTPWGTKAREVHEACERISCSFLVMAGVCGAFAVLMEGICLIQSLLHLL